MRLGFLTLLWVLLNNIEYFGKDTISTVLTIVSFVNSFVVAIVNFN